MDPKIVDEIRKAEERRVQWPDDPPDIMLPSLGMGIDRHRVEIEFYCAECRHYTYVKLNTSLEGNHVMICPNCGHEHFRTVKNGIITGDRWDKNKPIVDEIITTKAASVPAEKRRKRGEISIVREMEACGLLK